MASINSPYFSINYGWASGEDGWNSGMDSNLLVTSFLLKGSVDSFVASLPLSPSEGDSVILTTDNQAYFFVNGDWFFVSLEEGFEFNVLSDDTRWRYESGSFVEIPTNYGLKDSIDSVQSDVTTLEGTVSGLEDFHSDLQNDTDPAKGAVIVGYRGRSVADRLDDAIHVEQYHTFPGDDFTAAINAALAANDAIVLSAKSYRITSTVNVAGGKTIFSNNAVIEKDFDGVGVAFSGGSNFNYVMGKLFVEAIGSNVSVTSADSESPSAHGVTITDNRLVVIGEIQSLYHKGNGFLQTSASPNSNRSILSYRARFNGVHGIQFSGSHDDAAVYRVQLYADGNRKSGVVFDSDYAGRAWQGFIYTENNAADGTSTGCDIKKLRDSDLTIYSEEQEASAREVVLGVNCSGMTIRSKRRSKDDDYSLASSRNTWKSGQKTYTPGYPGGPRNGVAASFQSDRARTTESAEYVEMQLLGNAEALFGALRGYGGIPSPSANLCSPDATTRFKADNDGAAIVTGGAEQFRATGANFNPASDSSKSLGATSLRYEYIHTRISRCHPYTVATLPLAATAGIGARAFVSDANGPSFGAAVVGGGTIPTPVYSTGSSWRVG
tara:strand:+ start:42088 stop:43911 length:1824 start_codon:yes stop_codon:yes gene_type:complete